MKVNLQFKRLKISIQNGGSIRMAGVSLILRKNVGNSEAHPIQNLEEQEVI